MTETEVRFKFEGMLADRHRLDASDGVAFHEAARQYVALHAYFYVHGSVPKGGAINHTREYRVYEGVHREGSIELVQIVEHFVQGISTVIGMKTGGMLFEEFLRESLARVLNKKRRPPSLLFQNQTPLTENDSNHRPIFDDEVEWQRRWDDLRDRSTSAAVGWMRPIGRSADTVVLIAGGRSSAKLGRAELQYLQVSQAEIREMHISNAVRNLRQSALPMQLS